MLRAGCKVFRFKRSTWHLLKSFYSLTGKRAEVYEFVSYGLLKFRSKKTAMVPDLFTSRENRIWIIEYRSSDDARAGPKEAANTATLFLRTTDEADVNKILKALKHLAMLNGAKLVNDELF